MFRVSAVTVTHC